MERQLPVVEIAGINFYVDVLRDELRQIDSTRNRISFNELEESESGYSFLYNTETKNVPNEKFGLYEAGHICRVILPALMELDPAGIAEKYGIPLEALSPDFPYTGGRVTAKILPWTPSRNNKKK